MEKKKCNKCLDDKTLECFHKQPKSIDGYKTICKECVKKTRKVYLKANRGKINETQKEWAKANPDKIKEIGKTFRSENKKKINKKQKLYRSSNKEKIAKAKKKYCKKNKEKIEVYRKDYYKENKEAILKKNRDWNKKNAHIVSWRSILKSQLRRFGKKKEGKTIDLLGYSALELKQHIESLFTEGMTWDNHGKWEIDHKKPVSSFDENTHPSIVNALSNLQPLWRLENRTKYNK